MREQHTIPAFYELNSEVLILGSFPSVKSREEKFYYAHPQNRFWKVLAGCWEDIVPVTLEEKKKFLSKHHIALWDVIASCEIKGSQDSSIENIQYNDIEKMIGETRIQKIIVNGGKAGALFRKKYKEIGRPVYYLHSTSPANASWRLERLLEEWKRVLNP